MLIETKQIIPDKNLFGKNHFAFDAFDVIIQLIKVPGYGGGRSRAQMSQLQQASMTTSASTNNQDPNSNRIKECNCMPDDRDDGKNAHDYNVKDVSFPIAAEISQRETDADTSSHSQTNSDDDIAHTHGCDGDATSTKVTLEMTDKHDHANDANNVGSNSGGYDLYPRRKGTNVMKEGHKNGND